MGVLLIAFLAGCVSAAIALASGYGLLTAFGAYCLAGLVSVPFTLLVMAWSCTLRKWWTGDSAEKLNSQAWH
ncbi:MAG: hypothetical protein AB3N15_19135 [Paracoccaceae bacterium]